jgi:hypothetical protein
MSCKLTGKQCDGESWSCQEWSNDTHYNPRNTWVEPNKNCLYYVIENCENKEQKVKT